jgi:hypothetical protein
MFALRLQMAVAFLLIGEVSLNVILGVSMANVSVPQEMNVTLRVTRKTTKMLRLMAVAMTIIQKVTAALCWKLILALRPSVLVMSSSSAVFVEMVETLCPTKRAGDTSVLGWRWPSASWLESPPRRWVVAIGLVLEFW